MLGSSWQLMAGDYSDAVSKDLARQCYKNMAEHAEEYDRELKSKYSYYPAEKVNKNYKPNVSADIKIVFTDSFNEENWSTCEFNDRAQLLCFTDPFNLDNPVLDGKKLQKELCYSEPRRFK